MNIKYTPYGQKTFQILLYKTFWRISHATIINFDTSFQTFFIRNTNLLPTSKFTKLSSKSAALLKNKSLAIDYWTYPSQFTTKLI